MDALFELSRQLLGELDRPHRRNVPGGTGVVRLLLTGPRGVGKSTWIAQRVIGQYPDYAQSRRCLYLPVDHFRVSGLALYEVAEEFAHLGGELLCLDEVHRADGWSRDLKSIADSFPQLKVIASGSSLLHLERGSHDLSRRYLVAQMEGLSFREYLVLRHQVNFAVVTLEDVLHRHEEHVPDLVVKLKDNGLTVLEAFAEYLERGVYPFSFEFLDPAIFARTLLQSVLASLESDLPALHPTLTGASIQRIRRLLAAVATTVPFSPDLSKLRRLLHIADDRTLKDYLTYLEEAGLIRALRRQGTPFRSMDKPDRIYLGDPNLATALALPEKPDRGALRETFLLSSLPPELEVRAADKGDFLLANRFHIEVGGRNKDASQIKDLPEAFLALDNLPAGSGRRIPLWFFGFLT